MTDIELLRLLGGASFLQRELSLKVDAARKIFTRGVIPYKYRPSIKRIADRKRIKLPSDFLEYQRVA